MRLFIFLLTLTCLPSAYAETNLKALSGEILTLPQRGWVHLVFFNLWDSYGDTGARQTLALLPETFNAQATTVWIQPRINVTDAQLRKFQQEFPEVKPLVVDEGFTLMRHYGHWQLPAHVILHDGTTVFSGTSDAMQNYVHKITENKNATQKNSKELTP
ncbi:MAG TPA: hypothetical protein VIC08_11015 [Cellvibrionaceae bacterium]